MTIVIETVGATGPTVIDFTLASALAHVKSLSCWTTSSGAVFLKMPEVAVTSGSVQVTVPADSIWTLSTLANVGGKGGNGGIGKDQPQKGFPMPYSEDFESYELDTLPKYFSDMHGGAI